MTICRSVPLVLVAVLFASLSASAQTPMPPQSIESARAQDQTVRAMRNIGTALFSWLTDRVDKEDTTDLVIDPASDRACIEWLMHPEDSGDSIHPCELVAIDRLPLISYQELARLLVPKYIDIIPEKDGWGNPFEFRLDLRHYTNRSVMAIRSTGGDGVFSGDRYKNGSFLPAEAGEDLVWMDGYFVRWPTRKDIKDPEEN